MAGRKIEQLTNNTMTSKEPKWSLTICSRCKEPLEKPRVRAGRKPVCLRCQKEKNKIRYILKHNDTGTIPTSKENNPRR